MLNRTLCLVSVIAAASTACDPQNQYPGESCGAYAQRVCADSPDPVEQLRFAPAFTMIDEQFVAVFSVDSYAEHAWWMSSVEDWQNCGTDLDSAPTCTSCGAAPDARAEFDRFNPTYGQFGHGEYIAAFPIFSYIEHVMWMDDAEAWFDCVKAQP